MDSVMNKRLIGAASAVLLLGTLGFYVVVANPSGAAATGSDGPVYLYDGNYIVQDAPAHTWEFSGEVYASESATDPDDAFTCSADSTGAVTFISPRGGERDYTAWDATATQIFPAGSKNLLEVNFMPSAQVNPGQMSQSSIKQSGGDYSLGVACTKNNGVTVTSAWYRFITVTPVTGVWTAQPNDDSNGGTDTATATATDTSSADPSLGAGTDGLSLSAATTASWVKNSVYYQINPRNFSQTHDLAGVTSKINALSALGVGVIVLEPIFPVNQTGKPGAIGDIYIPSDTTSINPDLGSDADLTALIAAAHAQNIKVVMTWVSGYIGNDSSWITDHAEWFQHSGASFSHPAGKPSASLLDYSDQSLRAELITEMMDWVNRFDIDGIRSASASAQPTDFWDEASYRVNQIRPTLFVTSSPVSSAYTTHTFGADSRSDFLTALNKLPKGTTTNAAWKTTVTALATAAKSATNLNFLTDYNTSVLGKADTARFGASLKTALAFAYIAPGAPMLNAGQELDYRVLKSFDPDYISWPSSKPATTAFITKLAKLRTTNPAAKTGATSVLKSSLGTVLVIKRSTSAGAVYYLANLSKKAVTSTITFGKAASVYDFATGKKVALKASQKVTIPSQGFLIYSTKVVK